MSLPLRLFIMLCLLWLPNFAHAAKAGAVFRDCPSCPQMVVIPSGSFNMGSPPSELGRREDGDPPHLVKISSFALGKTEITRAQFATFVKKTNYVSSEQCWMIQDGKYQERQGNWLHLNYAQDDRHPVTCVSWEDAQAYAQWLSLKTKKQYRLPTEAEWEYAARAKTHGAHYWGESPDNACKYANVADLTAQAKIAETKSWKVHNCKDGFVYTAPVGSFKANTFGLKDMLGNVWEWTEDIYHDNYIDAPNDGSAWLGDGKRRVLRGGSWYDAPSYVRSAGRDSVKPDSRYDNFGFRLVRTLP